MRPPSPADIEAYAAAVTLSERRLADFAMPDPHNLPLVLDNQSPTYRTFMVHALEPEGSHGLVGRINVANVVGGAFRSATVGYDSYDPYAGRGLFAEGLRLALDLVFADQPQGMGLHRVEANIQPANHRSAGLVRVARLRPRGLLPRLPPPARPRRSPGLARPRPLHPALDRLARRALPPARSPRGSPASSLAPGPRATARRHDPGRRPRAELGIPLYSGAVVADTATLFELLACLAGRWRRRVPARPAPSCGWVSPGPASSPPACRSSTPPSTCPRQEVVRHALAVRAAYAAGAGRLRTSSPGPCPEHPLRSGRMEGCTRPAPSRLDRTPTHRASAPRLNPAGLAALTTG